MLLKIWKKTQKHAQKKSHRKEMIGWMGDPRKSEKTKTSRREESEKKMKLYCYLSVTRWIRIWRNKNGREKTWWVLQQKPRGKREPLLLCCCDEWEKRERESQCMRLRTAGFAHDPMTLCLNTLYFYILYYNITNFINNIKHCLSTPCSNYTCYSINFPRSGLLFFFYFFFLKIN